MRGPPWKMVNVNTRITPVPKEIHMFLHKEAMTSMSITAGRAMIQEKMPLL